MNFLTFQIRKNTSNNIITNYYNTTHNHVFVYPTRLKGYQIASLILRQTKMKCRYGIVNRGMWDENCMLIYIDYFYTVFRLKRMRINIATKFLIQLKNQKVPCNTFLSLISITVLMYNFYSLIFNFNIIKICILRTSFIFLNINKN